MRKTALALLLVLAACGTAVRLARVPVGTWGADDAGMLVQQTSAHVHIGCTKGDIPEAIPLDSGGRFDVEGTYNIDAYPVDRGIVHPARFTGMTDGRTLTLSVTLSDTGRVFGPVVLTFGVEPRMGVCPICRVPKERR